MGTDTEFKHHANPTVRRGRRSRPFQRGGTQRYSCNQHNGCVSNIWLRVWPTLWLTFPVRVYTRYKPIRPKWHWHNAWYALGSVVGLLFLGWMIWRMARSYDVQPALVENKPLSARAPVPAQPARPTNAPVAQPVQPMVTNTAPALQPDIAETPGMRPVRDVLEAQIALAARGISCGPLDGVLGSQTRAALRAYQRSAGLLISGMLDAQTRRALTVKTPVFTNYVVTREDVARLLPVSPTWVGKSQQLRMDYATLLELIAEKTRSHPGLVRRLNNGVDWDALGPGTAVTVVALEEPRVRAQAASVRISLADKILEVFDADGNLIAHFPCSIARAVEKRPLGQLRVVTVVRNPNYTFNPQLFPESAEARRLTQKLIIPPGPNNPVGTAWIGLDRPGYGIHGTPNPEQVGRTESHGCFRLANWDAEFLAGLVWVGMPVNVE